MLRFVSLEYFRGRPWPPLASGRLVAVGAARCPALRSVIVGGDILVERPREYVLRSVRELSGRLEPLARITLPEELMDQPSPSSAAPKLLHSNRVKLGIAVVATLVLIAGAVLAPPSVPAALSPPKEHSAPLLEQEVQRQAPLRGFSALREVGTRVAHHTIAIPGVEQATSGSVLDFAASPAAPSLPAGYGVVVSRAGDVLTLADALDGRSRLQVVLPSGGVADAELAAFEPATGLVLLTLSSTTGVSASPIATERAGAGTLVAAAARWNGSDIVVPAFVTEFSSGDYRVSAGGEVLRAATPIFTLDGDLVAIAAGTNQPGWAYSVPDALGRLRAALNAGRGQPPSLGLTLQPIEGALAQLFGHTGALVADVVDDGPADGAGIRPGDVLIEIGDAAVHSLEAAQQAIRGLVPGSEVVVRAVRNRQLRTISIRTGYAFDVAALLRRMHRAAADLGTVSTLLSAEQLRALGVPAAARVLAVNGRQTASRAEAAREIRRHAPVTLLYLQHEQSRFFVALQNQP